jgi:hypothetical protein
MFKDKIEKKSLKKFFFKKKDDDILDDIYFKTNIEQLISFNSKTNL